MFESGEVWAGLATVVAYLIARVFAYIRRELVQRGYEQQTTAEDCLEAGVQAAWDRFGRKWKAAKMPEVSKFSDDEKEKLRDVAVEVAIKAAAGKKIDLKRVLGEQLLPSLIASIVSRRKNRKR